MNGMCARGLVRGLLLLAGLAFGAFVQAQTPPALSTPNLQLVTNGTVFAIARQPDGGLIIGGSFTSVNGTDRQNLARIRPDGTLDTVWNPGADGLVVALAIDADGTVYATGDFSVIGGRSRHLAKISGNGAGEVDPQWDPGAGGSALALDSRGGLYVGGGFAQIGGQPRNNIARISTTGVGAADPAWNPGANGSVAALAVSPSGAVYAGGYFTAAGGQPRTYLAKLDSVSGAVDPNWNPSADSFVLALVVDANESVYASGYFTNIGGKPRSRLAKLSGTGGGQADTAWNPGPNGVVRALALDGAGWLVVGGDFGSIGGASQYYLSKVSATGTGYASGWQPSLNGAVRSVAVSPAGLVHAGGAFAYVANQPRLAFATFSADGTPSPVALDVESPGQVQMLAVQPNGGVIVGGAFFKANQQARRNLLRIDANGVLDPSWSPVESYSIGALAADASGAVYVGVTGEIYKLATDAAGQAVVKWRTWTNGGVEALVLDGSGALYAGGVFSTIGSEFRKYVAKLDGGSGAVDTSWNAGLNNNGYVRALAVAADGTLFLGGDFTSAGGPARNRIAKLDPQGVADPAWNPGADFPVQALALGSDGTVYAGGTFGTIGGQSRRRLAKLAASGVVDTDWGATVNDTVTGLALDGAGSVFVQGPFTTVNGLPRRSIAKLAASGAVVLDPDWNPEANRSVDALAIDGERVYVGGAFTNIGGVRRDGLAAFPRAIDPAATTLELTITPTATVVGQPYAVAFTVTAAPRAPTGTVTINDGQGSSCGPVVLTNGIGSCSLPSTQAGGFVLTATYTPDSGAFAPSSATAHHAVNRAETTLAILGHAPERTTPAQPVTITAALAVVSPGAGTPSGPITVGDGVDSCTIAAGATQCALTLTTRGPRVLSATYAGDANFIDSSAQVAHHVNRLPVAGETSYAAHADSALTVSAAQGVLAQASDPDGDALTVEDAGTLTAGGIGGTVVLNADGSFVYTPPTSAHGVATFDYTLGDGFESVSATATITVAFVNHAPHFALAPSPKWAAGANGARTHEGFATVTDFGAPNEADQHVLAWHLRPLGDPDGIVSNATIALDGTLSYTLSGRAGRATFGVRLQDDGGTANDGQDTSEEQTFTITVAAGLDLSVSLAPGIGFLHGGGPYVYEIAVHNAGPNDAIGARVQALLPFNLVDAVWACAAASAGAHCGSGVGDLDDLAHLPSGATIHYELGATVLADPEVAVEFTTTVTPPSGVPDLDVSNNSATRSDPVGVYADGFDRSLRVDAGGGSSRN